MKKYIACFILASFFMPIAIFAHQPNYIDKKIEIINTEPDISKAYYGELIGSKAVYTIYATSSLKLYVQILSPKIKNSNKNFTVLITDERQNTIVNLETPAEEWQSWYEDYGGDWYWQGPSFSGVIPAGTYSIVVSNPDNTGKYSLAIGETESFPIKQTLYTIQELYSIKTNFFNEPWYGIFYGIIGKYLLLSLAILIVILFVLIWFFVRLLKNPRKDSQKKNLNK
ncbi:MAG: hypothetical protein PHN74_02855 [Candidatus Pacebacteria bacterium]|nr:hypothetical protein [Candidatus Paceibacterota bacterium]